MKKLYTLNKWNIPAFMHRNENLFDGITMPSQQMGIAGNSSINYPYGQSHQSILPQINWNDSMQRRLAPVFTQGMLNTFSMGNNDIASNFGKSGLNLPNSPKEFSMSFEKNPNTFFNSALSDTGTEGGSFNWAGLGKAAAGAGAELAGSIGRSDTNKRGLWDVADPVHHLAGGRESAVGNAMGDIGVGLTKAGIQSGNPWLAVAGAGLKITGGLANAAFGMKVDKERLAAVNEGINKNRSFTSTASSFDSIQGPEAVQTNTKDIYKGGWFTSGADKNDALRQQVVDARNWADRSIAQNIYNLQNNQNNEALANYTAFGGPLDFEDSALGYGLAMDYLTMKKRESENKNKRAGLTQMPAFMPQQNTFAIGGDLQSHGADWSDGLLTIGAGGSHEENKYEGVQLGIDPEGAPNLVEEGETVWNDYVFSARIPIDQTTKELFHIGKKREMTYADLSKKLEEEIAERPNDPISKAGFEKQMQMLEEQQERQKQEMEAERAKAAFEALSPEEQTALMQQREQQEAMAQEAMQQEALAQQQAQVQPSPEEVAMIQQQQMMADGSQPSLGQEPQVMAEGGNLFPWGGLETLFDVIPKYTASRTAGYIPYIQDKNHEYASEDAVKAEEGKEHFKAWTDYVNSYWDNPDLDDTSRKQIEGYLRNLDKVAGGNHLFDKEGNMLEGAKDYFNHARTKNHKWGYYHLTPAMLKEAAKEAAVGQATAPERVIGMSRIGQKTPYEVATGEDERGKKTIISTPIPEEAAVEKPVDETKPKGVVPDLRKETSFGLWGPAIGLGMMGLGVGKPDTGAYDAAISGAGNYREANYQPIGNYLTYRPLDIWYQQNALNAQSRATDRQLMNTSGGNRGTAMAGLLANGR